MFNPDLNGCMTCGNGALDEGAKSCDTAYLSKLPTKPSMPNRKWMEFSFWRMNDMLAEMVL